MLPRNRTKRAILRDRRRPAYDGPPIFNQATGFDFFLGLKYMAQVVSLVTDPDAPRWLDERRRAIEQAVAAARGRTDDPFEVLGRVTLTNRPQRSGYLTQAARYFEPETRRDR